jgi:hypothetical protein
MEISLFLWKIFDLLENSHKKLHPGVHWNLYYMYMLGASSDQEWGLKCGWCGQFCRKLFSIVNDSSLVLLRKQPQEVCIFVVYSILYHDGWTPSWSLTESSSTVKFELHSAVDWVLGHEVWNSVSWRYFVTYLITTPEIILKCMFLMGLFLKAFRLLFSRQDCCLVPE